MSTFPRLAMMLEYVFHLSFYSLNKYDWYQRSKAKHEFHRNRAETGTFIFPKRGDLDYLYPIPAL